jgi:HD-GYP domain-containing protein (c-di-GMP phosphodiesterase class II)
LTDIRAEDQQSLIAGLLELHERIRAITPMAPLTRIAVAVYDEKSDLLRTFIHSSDGETPLNHYVAKMSEVPSLCEIAKRGTPRVVNDLNFYGTRSIHSRRVVEGGFRSSYTVPLMKGGELSGFLFFNSTEVDFFTPAILHQLWPYAQIAGFLAMMELDKIQVIQAAVKTVRQISNHRDEETGAHLERMSRYTRLIAEVLAVSHGLTDEYIEFLYQFAPLHDVGKVAIPDNILLKPGRLTHDEFVVMQGHVEKGSNIIELMMADFGMDQVPHIAILRNVVAYHHEAWDGSGYPFKLKGETIPLEARISAVADVFDALTSARPYKDAWSNDQALAHLAEMSGIKFYAPCVDALLTNRERILDIQARFHETTID